MTGASKIKSPPSSTSIISGAPAPTSYCILNNGHVLLLKSDSDQS